MFSYIQLFVNSRKLKEKENVVEFYKSLDKIEFYKSLKSLINDHNDQMTGTNDSTNINKLKAQITGSVEIKLSEFKNQIDAIINNIILDRQTDIQRKNQDEVKDDHGPKVEFDAFKIDKNKEFYGQKLEDLIKFREYMEN